MEDIFARIRAIQEGAILNEAEDNTYDIPDDQTNTDPEDSTDTEDSPDADETQPVTTDTMGDDDNDTQVDDLDGDTNDSDNVSSTDQSKPGEAISLTPSARAILMAKNFGKYRELHTSVSRLADDLTRMNTTKDQIREFINRAIVHATDLRDKLQDYIIYRYEGNSYEINYANFMNFIVEKRLIEEMIQQIHNQSYNDANK